MEKSEINQPKYKYLIIIINIPGKVKMNITDNYFKMPSLIY